MNLQLKRKLALATSLISILALSACASEVTPDSDTEALTVYSGRSEELIAPLMEKFTEETGIEVVVRYGDSAELAAQILEEGENRQADVFFAQDAGALGAISDAGLFVELTDVDTSGVADAFKSTDNTWIGVSGRARVFSYNPERVSEVPTSVLDLIDPSWKGRIGIAPANASFQAFITALRLIEGETVAAEFLAAMKTNAVFYEKNSLILEAVENGEIDAGLINHYYWYERAAEFGEENMTSEITWFEANDPGNLINVAGVGLLNKSEAANTFANWLLGESAQKFFVETTYEYSVFENIAQAPGLPALGEISAPDIDLADLRSLSITLEMISKAGLL
jgi:iron(III) transport system substrate-binding protein